MMLAAALFASVISGASSTAAPVISFIEDAAGPSALIYQTTDAASDFVFYGGDNHECSMRELFRTLRGDFGKAMSRRSEVAVRTCEMAIDRALEVMNGAAIEGDDR